MFGIIGDGRGRTAPAKECTTSFGRCIGRGVGSRRGFRVASATEKRHFGKLGISYIDSAFARVLQVPLQREKECLEVSRKSQERKGGEVYVV